MLFKRFRNKSSKRDISPFYDKGFHGDSYLIELVDFLIRDSDYFIETGTNVGSTLAYIAGNYPMMKCLSCEPDKSAFDEAVKNVNGLSNVLVYNMTSQEFINHLMKEKIAIFKKKCLFWLDAHGYGFRWPLKDEIKFITSNFKHGYILIDDFKVPDIEKFKWDKYEDQECSFDFIRDSINREIRYSLYYPCYTERTSKHHALTGWGLIDFGHDRELEIPDKLKDKIKKGS